LLQKIRYSVISDVVILRSWERGDDINEGWGRICSFVWTFEIGYHKMDFPDTFDIWCPDWC
jgi:hypothetical protein